MRIITDSTCDINLDITDKMEVSVTPLKVNFGMKEYVDKYELSSKKFFEMLEESEVIPTTTLVSAGEFEDEFSKHNEEIVGIFISSKISGTFQAAQMAKKALGREDIYLVDSGTASLGLGLLVRKAVQLREQGLSAKEIYDELNVVKEKLVVYAMVDTLKYLVKGGRLSKTQGMLGSFLSVKPIICVSQGKIESVGKARGVSKSLDLLVSLVNQNYTMKKEEQVVFTFSKNPELLGVIKERFPACKNSVDCEMGSVIGTHVGPNVMGIAFFYE